MIAVCAFGAFAGFLFLITLYLQDVRHLEPLYAGLYLLPLAVVTVIFAPLSGRMVANRGPRQPLLAAGALLTVGALLLVPTSAHEAGPQLIVALTVFALGFAFVNAPITNTAVSGMPRAQAGVAAAVASTSRQVGTALGVAVIGSVLASGLGHSLADGFVPASRAAWWIVVGCSAAVLVLGAATTGRRARASAERAAALISSDDATPAGPDERAALAR